MPYVESINSGINSAEEKGTIQSLSITFLGIKYGECYYKFTDMCREERHYVSPI